MSPAFRCSPRPEVQLRYSVVERIDHTDIMASASARQVNIAIIGRRTSQPSRSLTQANIPSSQALVG
jgi:hypothetical protein